MKGYFAHKIHTFKGQHLTFNKIPKIAHGAFGAIGV